MGKTSGKYTKAMTPGNVMYYPKGVYETRKADIKRGTAQAAAVKSAVKKVSSAAKSVLKRKVK